MNEVFINELLNKLLDHIFVEYKEEIILDVIENVIPNKQLKNNFVL